VKRLFELIEAAPSEKVIVEQVAYLIVHEAGCGIPGCPDCERLGGVREVLLQPFRTVTAEWARERMAKAA